MILFAEWQLDISLFEVRTFPKTFFAENWRTKRRELVTGNSDYTGKTSADMNGVIDDGRNV